ncbi:predicted protein [Chaetoceros tenuissimus]|uniref:F-box domain-containing protein n=1 Tax=Chaetoceros tenuissimus TaxID=426638 RepID=A0AAD3D6F8_9STRA|nr:predicted protein [Chaetoceros tenuissimus]
MDQHAREVKKQKTETSTMSLSSDISIEIQRLIFTFLDVPSLGKMVLVSQHFRNLATSDEYWSQPLENLIAHFDKDLSGDFVKLSDRPQKSTEFAKWIRDWFHVFQGSPPEPYTLENIYKSSHSDFFKNEKDASNEYDSDHEEDSSSDFDGWISRRNFETMTHEEKEKLLKEANDCEYTEAIFEHYCSEYWYCDSIILQKLVYSKQLIVYQNTKNLSSADWVVSENDLSTKREYYAKLGQLLTAGKQRSKWDEHGILDETNRCAHCGYKLWWEHCWYDGKSKLYAYAKRNLPKIQLFHYLKYDPGPNAKGYPEPMREDEMYGNSSSEEEF